MVERETDRPEARHAREQDEQLERRRRRQERWHQQREYAVARAHGLRPIDRRAAEPPPQQASPPFRATE
jgi:hypothetical protein